MNWNGTDEIVAEGRWESKDPKALVNGKPIGPNVVKIYIDEVFLSDTFLWRPASTEICTLEDSLKAFVVWPANKVGYIANEDLSPSDSQAQTPQVQTISPELDKSSASPSAHVLKAKKITKSHVRRSLVSMWLYLDYNNICGFVYCYFK